MAGLHLARAADQLRARAQHLVHFMPSANQRVVEYIKNRVNKDLGALERQIVEIEKLPSDQLLGRMGDLIKLYREHKVKLDDGISTIVIGLSGIAATGVLSGALSIGWSALRGWPVTDLVLAERLAQSEQRLALAQSERDAAERAAQDARARSISNELLAANRRVFEEQRAGARALGDQLRANGAEQRLLTVGAVNVTCLVVILTTLLSR